MPHSLTVAGRLSRRTLLRGMFGLLWLLWGGAIPAAADPSVPLEYKVKAAFLYNFTRFVDWPAPPAGSTDAPLIIGICGRNPFGAELAEGVRGRTVHGRPIELRNIESLEAAREVHLLFVPATEEARALGWLEKLSGTPILTVGETERFASAGGMIRFVREDDRVRFDINIEPAERSRLRISAQLQKLARNVRKKS